MNFSETTKIRAARLPNMPPEKLISKAQKTALGLGSIVTGLLIAVFLIPPLSVWCVYALLVYGGYCIAGDITRNFAAFVPAVIRDIYAAVRGNGSS